MTLEQNLPKLQRLCTAAEMQHMEQRAIQELGIPSIVLMENAAHSVVHWLTQNLPTLNHQSKIVVCCGKGNNGGDGFAIARLLKNRNFDVTTLEAGNAKTKDAQLNQQLWKKFGEGATWGSEKTTERLQQADLIVDALFGTGLARPISGEYQTWMEHIQNTQALKIAVDLPSGIHSETGQVLGAAVACQHTVSFQVGKQGCYQPPGVQFAGEVTVADISVPPHWDAAAKPTYLLTKPFIQGSLPPRMPQAHKGTYGHLLAICGSAGMGGAAQLAAHGAIKNGTGLVSACVPRCLQDGFLGTIPEVMTVSPSEGSPRQFTKSHLPFVEGEIQKRDAVVLGCGLGQNSGTKEFVQHLVASVVQPMLLDADGLNNIRSSFLEKRTAPTVITPHPRELSRLCGLTTEEIQKNRLEICRTYAQQWGVVLLLKGAHTVIGDPQGRVFINPTGHEGMATAGAGDVLSGIIGGFLAQGCSPLQGALLGAYLHGLAGDCLKKTLVPAYMSALDLIHGLNEARQVLEQGAI